MWFGKLVLEYFIFIAYSVLIAVSDWQKISEISSKRQKEDNIEMEKKETGRYKQLEEPTNLTI